MTQSPETLPLPSFDKPVKLLIVVADCHRGVAQSMLDAAQAVLAGVQTEVVWMPTALELAPAIALAERMAKFDGYVALSAVMQSDTQAQTQIREASSAITLLGLQGAAVGNGVCMVEDFNPFIDFAAAKAAQAAAAALHLIALSRKWATDTKGIGFRP